ncbi:MAG: S-adenosylmethionine:tRNA ribosyltransferase-isomerase [Bacteroidales bacterium]|nr:S-adenosylmethionine:tRNA ribosyltransferase-isomerase [Bacteroidales bacterium]
MNDPKSIAISDYDYPLPEERIAKYPLAQRDQSKLLVYKNGTVTEDLFRNVPDLLPDDTLLVFNNTKVIHARLVFQKETGSTIEIFCLEPFQTAISEAFEQRERCTWLCFIGNNKKWKSGILTKEVTANPSPLSGHNSQATITLTATRREPVGNAWIVDFSWTGGISFAELIECAGVIPLPPYLHREAERDDNTRYQTVYADPMGSVAAPTAGLHFTDEVFNHLNSRHIATEFLTLHVGAGTFKPVSSETIGEHEMHTEKIVVHRSTIQHILQHDGKPLIAVGTTSVRTLESIYWFGIQLGKDPTAKAMHVEQWEPYKGDATPSLCEAYGNVLAWLDSQSLDTLYGETRLIIAPGYKYHVINGMITNFHQPKSTLLLLVSALIGDRWKDCYRYALDHNFRFLSYGDSCLLLP